MLVLAKKYDGLTTDTEWSAGGLANRSFVLLLIGVLALAATACSSSPSAPTTPAGYANFTDETRTFSIDYPPEWELSQALIETLIDQVATNSPELDLSTSQVVFIAGLSSDAGLDPNVNIIAETLPGAMSIDRYGEAAVAQITQAVPSVVFNERRNGTVNGLSARFVDWNTTGTDLGFSDSSEVRIIQMYTLQPDQPVAWTVTCTGISPIAENFQEICASVLNSFKILK